LIERACDLWEYAGDAIVAITTSGSVTRDGRAVLGQGCARQANIRYPGLSLRLGALVRARGNHVHDLGNGLASFPVEETAWSLPDPAIISRSAGELQRLADARGWTLVALPRPGCGGGGLSWVHVKPLLEPHLDDRFVVVERVDVP
jgi:hypothetical protein